MAPMKQITGEEQSYAAACVWEFMFHTYTLAEGHEWSKPMLAVWKKVGTVEMRYKATRIAHAANTAWNFMTDDQRDSYNGADNGFDFGFIPQVVKAVAWKGTGFEFDIPAFIKSITRNSAPAPVNASTAMAFEYFEVRPCIESADASGEKSIDSYVTEESYQEARDDLDANGTPYETFWTVYGRYNDGAGAFLAEAIADRATKEKAHKLMNAILAPMAAARDKINDGEDEDRGNGSFITAAERAACDLDDVINQSSNWERI